MPREGNPLDHVGQLRLDIKTMACGLISDLLVRPLIP